MNAGQTMRKEGRDLKGGERECAMKTECEWSGEVPNQPGREGGREEGSAGEEWMRAMYITQIYKSATMDPITLYTNLY